MTIEYCEQWQKKYFDFTKVLITKLNASNNCLKISNKLLIKGFKKNLQSGKSIHYFCSGIVYTALILDEDRRTQREISNTLNILRKKFVNGEPIIRKHHKLIINSVMINNKL